ncbi:MAG: RNA pseudouridine synthase, partial [Bdellovibrionota bacterium]
LLLLLLLFFENENFFVINKPAGIASQATLTSSTDTIFHMLVALNSQKFRLSDMFMVHRLDKETSGIMLIARNKDAQKKFEDMFRDKKILKTYDALCFYSPQKNAGMITFPIAKDKSRQNCYYAQINSKTKDAKEAHTEYKVLHNYKSEASYIQCYPKTGRTHQIRVHLAAIGCPILGDKTYSQNIYGHRFTQIALRHMLHASKIQFEFEGKNYNFSAPFPEDFTQVLKNLV